MMEDVGVNNEIRVVITAMGVISPIGIGKEEFSSSLKERKNGIKISSYLSCRSL